MNLKELFLGRKCKDSKCYTHLALFKAYIIVTSFIAGLASIPLYQYLTKGYFCIGCAKALGVALFN